MIDKGSSAPVIGLYDSGLGGLSVLKAFIKEFKDDLSFVYVGDSARAPYGTKSREDLINCVEDIFSYFTVRKLDLVVSACNTSSVYLDEMNLSDYPFTIVSLFKTMQQYFKEAKHEKAALLATPSTIASKRYLEWDTAIHPLACPDLVLLMEAGDLDAARVRFLEYLEELPKDIYHVIIGCTHYSFLKPAKSRFNFIDPAEIVVKTLKPSLKSMLKECSKPVVRHNTEIYCTGNLEVFNMMLAKLLGADFQASKIELDK